MTGPFALLAFGMPSTGEWVVLLVVGLLIFGRRLPEVGKSLAKTIAQFRRGLQDFKREMDQDEDLKDVKSTVSDLKKSIDAPRILANPGKLLDSFDEELDAEEQAERERKDLGAAAQPEPKKIDAAREELPAQGVEEEEKA